MTTLIIPHEPHPLIRAARELWHASPTLVALSLAFLLGFAVTALLGQVDPRTLQGVSVWSKPSKFFLSVAVHYLTLVWALTFLPATPRWRWQSLAVAVLVVCAVFELGYITMQGALGERSHFNTATLFHNAMYSLMGLGALTMLAVTGLIGVRVLRRGIGAPVLVRAVGLALIASAVLGGASGIYLSGGGGHWVGGVPTDAGGLPLFGWSRTGGDLRIAHFVGLHAMQVIPAIGFVVQRQPNGHRIVTLALAGWTVLAIAAFAQALMGLPLIPA